jgi:hypothetical protein
MAYFLLSRQSLPNVGRPLRSTLIIIIIIIITLLLLFSRLQYRSILDGCRISVNERHPPDDIAGWMGPDDR